MRIRAGLAVAIACSLALASSLTGCVDEGEPTGAEPGPSVAARSEAPSPLFGEVEQLVPAELPDGWARCGGGPSTRRGAPSSWWSQTFGPEGDGSCRPLVTVTQIQPGSGFDPPTPGDDVKIAGDADALRWEDESARSAGLLTWAFDQELLVEACCGAAAVEHLEAVAGAALIGTREQAPQRCLAASSDLSAETLIENLTAKRGRMEDGSGCPIRADIAQMETHPSDAHCWAGMTFLVLGTPAGASTHDSERRTYVRDPGGDLPGDQTALDVDAQRSPDAIDTGYTKDGRTVWITEADPSVVFIVTDETAEAWPRYDLPLRCA